MTLKTRLEKIERARPTVPALVDWEEFQTRMIRKMELAINGQADPSQTPLQARRRECMTDCKP